MNLENDSMSWEPILTKCLIDLDKMYPKLKESQIAEKVSITRGTFNRMKNKRKLPQLDNVLKLLIGSGNSSLLNQAISLVDSDLGKSLNVALEVSMKEQNKKLLDSELEEILNDRDVFISYLLASMTNGTNKEQLIQTLGSIGPDSIQKLMEKGIVSQEGDTYKVCNSGTLVRSFGSIKRHLSTYAKFYKTEHVGRERNYGNYSA